MKGADPDELISAHARTRQTRASVAVDVLEWFLDGNAGEFYPRGEARDEIAESLSLDKNTVNRALGDLIGDIVDPVQQITADGAKYVGVIEYRVFADSGAYGYVDFDDRKGKRRRVVCARCVEKHEYDEHITHATQGEDTSTGASWQELLKIITSHYADSHKSPPDKIEPGASLASGTTIAGNIAFHGGNDGSGSGLTADGVSSFQSKSDVSGLSEGDLVFIRDEATLFVQDGTGLKRLGGGGGVIVEAQGPIGTSTSSTGSIASLGTKRRRLAAASVDGKLYAVGGFDKDTNELGSVEEYNPAADTWRRVVNFRDRQALGAASLNGKLYAVGGFDRNVEVTDVVQQYVPATDIKYNVAPLSTARADLGVASVDGKLYAVGGVDTNNDKLASVEEYDPATDNWSTISPLNTARERLGAASVDGKLYAVGGNGDSGRLASVEEYDPATDNWSTISPLNTARENLGATGLTRLYDLNQKLYAVGGVDTNNDKLASVEEYDPATDNWSTISPLNTARERLGAASIDGKLYAIGGKDDDSFVNELASVEEIAFSPVASDVYTAGGRSVVTVDGPDGFLVNRATGLRNDNQMLVESGETVAASLQSLDARLFHTEET